MKLISVFKKYFALNSDQKKFVTNPKMVMLKKPTDILTFLKPLANFDSDCDSARHTVKVASISSFILLLIVAIVGANSNFVSPYKPVLIILAVIMMIFMFLWIIFRNIDIHNNLRDFVVPVVNALSLDAPDGGKFRLNLDLRSATTKDKQVNIEKIRDGWLAGYPKITTTTYKNNWFLLNASLCDGSNVIIQGIDTVKKVKIVKRSASGKRKSKTKIKIKHLIRSTLGLKKKRYELNLSAANTASGGNVKTKDNAKKSIVRMSKVVVDTDLSASVDAEIAISLVGKILMSAKPAGNKGA